MTPSIVKALTTAGAPETPQIEDHDSEAKSNEPPQATLEPSLDEPELGKPISHSQIVGLWKRLKAQGNANYTLEQLLRGASVYIPPPPPKPEPSPQYKALMARLRRDEEARSYERMINPVPQQETFKTRFPYSAAGFAEANRPTSAADIGDEDIAMEEVHKQVTLIINFLVSIAGVAGTLWVTARWWSVSSRLFLTMGGSILVAIAEVVVYNASSSPALNGRPRAKPLRTYGKRSIRDDSPKESNTKKQRVSSEATSSETSISKNTNTIAQPLPKIIVAETKDTTEFTTNTDKLTANPPKKGSIMSFFKPIPSSSSTAASSPKSDEPQPETTPPSSPPQPARIETRKKPRLLRFRGTSLPVPDNKNTEDAQGELTEAGDSSSRSAIRDSSLNRESSTGDVKAGKKAKAKLSTVQTTLNLSAQAAFSECKICNTVWNPLYPDDVKFHTKQHAAVLRARRKEKENEL
ncbi:Ff.00g053300.m01.CDS01 [Fusarium sp. VM40]|nr:Ff.00g053300.m01.CDS01 [Fusarium sp. VM40]